MTKKGKRILSLSINFQKRDRLGLTNDQYIILSAIYFRQCAPSGNGWCNESNLNLSYYIEKTDRTVQSIKKFLIEKGFIIRNNDDEVKAIQEIYDFLYMQEEDEKVMRRLGDLLPQKDEENDKKESKKIRTSTTTRKNFTHENDDTDPRKKQQGGVKMTTQTHEKISPKDRIEDRIEDNFKKEKKIFKISDHELFRMKINYSPIEMQEFQKYLSTYINGIMKSKFFDGESHRMSFLKIQLDQVQKDLEKRAPLELMTKRFTFIF